MHGIQACLSKYITVAAFCIFVLRGEDAAKRGGWKQCIKSLIMENHGNILKFCFKISVGTLLRRYAS